MSLPFTVNQFLEVFRDYNLSIWPMQAAAYILAAAAVLLAFKRTANSDRIISAILSLFWIWNGAAYHIMFFTGINKAAYIFGAAFIIQGMLLFFYGTVRNRISFTAENYWKATGSLFILYAALIYPAVGQVLGHGYPFSPLLGAAPCPTTIFTFGMFLLAKDTIPWRVLWIPLLWSLIGFNASWALGIREDVGLLAAGVISTALIVFGQYKYRQEGSRPIIVEK